MLPDASWNPNYVTYTCLHFFCGLTHWICLFDALSWNERLIAIFRDPKIKTTSRCFLNLYVRFLKTKDMEVQDQETSKIRNVTIRKKSQIFGESPIVVTQSPRWFSQFRSAFWDANWPAPASPSEGGVLMPLGPCGRCRGWELMMSWGSRPLIIGDMRCNQRY